jgi:hypothetical protein
MELFYQLREHIHKETVKTAAATECVRVMVDYDLGGNGRYRRGKGREILKTDR